MTGVISFATIFRFPVYGWCFGPMPVLTSAHSSIEGTGCRAARGTGVPAKGALRKDVPLGRIPVDGSTPLKGRQPELVDYQSLDQMPEGPLVHVAPQLFISTEPSQTPRRGPAGQAGPRRESRTVGSGGFLPSFCPHKKKAQGPGPRRPRGFNEKRHPCRAKRGSEAFFSPACEMTQPVL